MTDEGRLAVPRSDVRSNVFLAAILVADERPRPVRVRNISAGGALVDGANLPSKGTVIELVRGSLNARGEVAWRDRDQCGLRFETGVVVEDWVRKVEHPGQQRVDQIVSLHRRPASVNVATPPPPHQGDSLQSISTDLSELCEHLVSLPDLVANHSNELLRLDAIAQRLSSFSKEA